MSIPFQYSGGSSQVKLYNVTGYDPEKLPEWILSKAKASNAKAGTRKNQRKLELLQDFAFPMTSQCIKFSRNGQFIIGTGTYKPQIRVWDTNQCSLKFERHTNAETIAFETLEEDWTKLMLLQADRSLEFHTQGGIYYSTRIPKHGRDLLYDPFTAEAIAVGSAAEVYRLSLHEGRFMKPIETNLQYINSVKLNPCHRLLSVGGSRGVIEFIDLRMKTNVGNFKISAEDDDVTALEFLPDGTSISTGSSSGIFRLFDLRMNSSDHQQMISALMTRDFHSGEPISKIQHIRDRLTGEQPVLFYVTDGKHLKVWNRDTGDLKISLEKHSSTSKINDFTVAPETPGFFAVAMDCPQIQSYFVPSLGPAPKWASYLDALTEELEESEQTSVYNHLKFVTASDVHALGLSHLLNALEPQKKPILRPYMHGYFIDFKLYNQLKSVMNPFEYEDYLKKKQLEKLEKARSSRITGHDLPTVNRKLYQKTTLDSRFQQVFENPEFEINEDSPEYKLIHPSERKVLMSIPAEDISPSLDAVDSPDDTDGEDHPTKYSYHYTGNI